MLVFCGFFSRFFGRFVYANPDIGRFNLSPKKYLNREEKKQKAKE
jgi:hypothetical protein